VLKIRGLWQYWNIDLKFGVGIVAGKLWLKFQLKQYYSIGNITMDLKLFITIW
jgi:hypothetical protein